MPKLSFFLLVLVLSGIGMTAASVSEDDDFMEDLNPEFELQESQSEEDIDENEDNAASEEDDEEQETPEEPEDQDDQETPEEDDGADEDVQDNDNEDEDEESQEEAEEEAQLEKKVQGRGRNWKWLRRNWKWLQNRMRGKATRGKKSKKSASTAVAGKKGAKEARLQRLYNNLKSRYASLSSEISSQIQALLRKRYAWLKLLYSRRKWFLINRRYRQLAVKFKNLPSKKFWIDAYKKYTKSEEYRLKKNRKQYQMTCKRANKYMKNVRRWVSQKRASIEILRRRLRSFLRKNKNSLTKKQREDLRVHLRRKLRKERRNLDAAVKFWKNRIYTGDLPVSMDGGEKKPKVTSTLKTTPISKKNIPTPRPLVKPLGAKKTTVVVKNGKKTVVKKQKWGGALKHVFGGKRKISKFLGKVNSGRRIRRNRQLGGRKLRRGNGWFSPLRMTENARRRHRVNRRMRREQRRLRSALNRANKGWRSDKKSRRWRNWKRMVRGVYKSAWKINNRD